MTDFGKKMYNAHYKSVQMNFRYLEQHTKI